MARFRNLDDLGDALVPVSERSGEGPLTEFFHFGVDDVQCGAELQHARDVMMKE